MTNTQTTPKKQPDPTLTKLDYFPCPFCGADVEQVPAHDPDCYFTHSNQLKNENQADVFLALKLIKAWKKRYIPAGYKLVPTQLEERFAEDWHKKTLANNMQTDNLAILTTEEIQNLYTSYITHLGTQWELQTTVSGE